MGLSEPGYEQAFRGNYYLNLGTEYMPTNKLTIRFDAYNILGWLDS